MAVVWGMAGATAVFGQNKMQALFAGNDKLTFLGVDFTQAHYVGPEAFPDPGVIQNGHIKSWNSLLVLEPKKYSLQAPFKIKNSDQYETSIDDMTRINTKAEVESNITDTPQELTEAAVRKIASGYTLGPKEGVGVVYLAENLDKRAEKFTVWVVFVDLSSRQVLYTERIEGKPGGFGLRNYWAGGISSINKAIASTYYKKWAKQFR